MVIPTWGHHRLYLYRSLAQVADQLPPRLHQLGAIGTSCALGMFDGVHLGHRMVFENALREARLLNLQSVVFSFADHPQKLLSKTPTALLSTLDERLALFKAAGFEHAVILDFDDWLKNLSALDFVRQILVQHLHSRVISVGYDYRFGQARQGDGAYLAQCGQSFGFDVQIIDPVRVQDQIVSSTLIRKLLTYSSTYPSPDSFETANTLLGYPYALSGTVVHGVARGRGIGFPTANIETASERLLPASGVYGGVAELNGRLHPAVCNIGLCPTFSDQTRQRLEVHLLDYNGDAFYGETLRFHFCQKLREEQSFADVRALVAQIQRDCELARQQSAAWLSMLKPVQPLAPTLIGAYLPISIPSVVGKRASEVPQELSQLENA